MIKILIAEDDATIGKILKISLKNWGYEVAGVATNLPEALAEAEKAKTKGVAIAIVDGNLGSCAPGTTRDGEAVAAKLREYAPDVRIIAHTGAAEGKYGYIFVQKPSPPQEMKAAIEKALAMSPTK